MQPLAQQVCAPRLIVDVTNQGILHRNSPTGHIGVVAGGIERFVDLPPVVDRHQRVTQLVVRGMQRQR
jgi:hypothetical protein